MNSLNVLLILTFTSSLTVGCASIETSTPGDPLESINRPIHKFNSQVDKAVLKPVAQGYTNLVAPEFRSCVGNFFANLDDVNSTVNHLLQGKLVGAFNDACRVVLNSTVGLFGLVDAASELGFRKTNDEDFGQTLGYWGVGSGPYLVVPFYGPSTLRDFTGRLVDGFLDPLANHKPVDERLVGTAVNVVDTRARLMPATDLVDRIALDSYSFVRDAYLSRRASQIRDGKPEDEEIEQAYPEMGASLMRRTQMRSVVFKPF